MNVEWYSRCECGAVALCIDGQTYFAAERNMKQYFPGADLRKCEQYATTYCCDHCINHYGVDLCACGSGEPFKKCTNKYNVCGRPMQVLGVYGRVCAAHSWGGGNEAAYEFYH